MVIGGSLLAALGISAGIGLLPDRSLPLNGPGEGKAFSFGNSGTNFTGWQAPPYTLISTTFVAPKSLNHFVGATVYVFPYRIRPDSSLFLGMYVNEGLSVTQTYNLSQSRAPTAMVEEQLLTVPGNNLAEFTHTMEGYTVTLFLGSSLPTGTRISIVIIVTEPLWIQIAGEPSVLSYESPGVDLVPASMPSGTQFAAAPNSLNIQVMSSAA